jgi:hypothetical protein
MGQLAGQHAARGAPLGWSPAHSEVPQAAHSFGMPLHCSRWQAACGSLAHALGWAPALPESGRWSRRDS